MGRSAGTDQTEARVRSRQLEVQEWSSGERCGPETEVVESLCIDTPYSMEQVGAPGQGEIKWLGSTENGNPGALQWWQAGKEIPENETEWQMKEDTNITTSKENGFKSKKGGGDRTNYQNGSYRWTKLRAENWPRVCNKEDPRDLDQMGQCYNRD